jgi:hypothetical protein
LGCFNGYPVRADGVHQIGQDWAGLVWMKRKEGMAGCVDMDLSQLWQDLSEPTSFRSNSGSFHKEFVRFVRKNRAPDENNDVLPVHFQEVVEKEDRRDPKQVFWLC